MKANETQSSDAAGANFKLSVGQKHGSGQYQKVFDSRKRRLRGVWERNGTFYGQMTITNAETGAKAVRRVRLEDKEGNLVSTVTQAVAVLTKMKGQREDDALKITLKRTPNPGRQNFLVAREQLRRDDISSIALQDCETGLGVNSAQSKKMTCRMWDGDPTKIYKAVLVPPFE